ncbi:MAG: right-handed parallel beta-helix repeat-containing protein [Thermomicrobiales bacterium]
MAAPWNLRDDSGNPRHLERVYPARTGDNLDHEDAAAIVVEDGSAVVTGNQIEDALFGIYLKNAHGSVLRDNVILSKNLPTARKGDSIKTWYSDNVVIEDNYASDVATSFSGI